MSRETFRILVIDDDPALHDEVRQLLAPPEPPSARYRVDSLYRGEDAIDAVNDALEEGRPYAVAVVDARMPPGWDGVETIARIWEHHPDLQVVLCTAYSDRRWSDLAARLGRSDDFLVLDKPFDPIELQQMVSSLSRKWWLARAERDRDRLRRVNEIYRASEVIFATPDSRDLPQVIVRTAMSAMGADYAAIMVRDREGRMSLFCSHGVPPESAESDESRETAVVEGGSIHYPLYSGERLIAELRFERCPSKAHFDHLDLERAAVVASRITLALENNRLMRQAVASERLAAIGELAAGVSHEINTPLSFLLAGSDYLREIVDELFREGAPSPDRLAELKSVVSDIGEGASRIRDIARDLRTLARHDELSSRIDLAEVVRSAMRVASSQARYRANIVSELRGPLEVAGSAGRLSQVFINLIVNAAQAFGDRPAHQNEIVVSCERKGDQIFARVRDNGPGIAPEHMPRIFEPFFTTKETIGTGLGLSISRDIIRAHRGELHVESSPGRGATFSIVLPAANAA